MSISASARLKRRRMWINTIKTGAGCVDCGYNKHAVALHFDHKDRLEKAANVSQLVGSKLKWLFKEIRKCEVRCANCHAVKTVEEKEYETLHKRAGRPERILDNKKRNAAWDLWKAGATVHDVKNELKISFYRAKKLVEDWEKEKEKVRKLALQKPTVWHPWHKQRWEEVIPPYPPSPDPEWEKLNPYESAVKRMELWSQWNKTKSVHKYHRKSSYKEYFEQVYEEPLITGGDDWHV